MYFQRANKRCLLVLTPLETLVIVGFRGLETNSKNYQNWEQEPLYLSAAEPNGKQIIKGSSTKGANLGNG